MAIEQAITMPHFAPPHRHGQNDIGHLAYSSTGQMALVMARAKVYTEGQQA